MKADLAFFLGAMGCYAAVMMTNQTADAAYLRTAAGRIDDGQKLVRMSEGESVGNRLPPRNRRQLIPAIDVVTDIKVGHNDKAIVFDSQQATEGHLLQDQEPIRQLIPAVDVVSTIKGGHKSYDDAAMALDHQEVGQEETMPPSSFLSTYTTNGEESLGPSSDVVSEIREGHKAAILGLNDRGTKEPEGSFTSSIAQQDHYDFIEPRGMDMEGP